MNIYIKIRLLTSCGTLCIDKPGPPNRPIKITKIEQEECSVEWEAPSDDGGSPLTGYTVEKRETSEGTWTKITRVEREVTYTTVEKLQQDVEYIFRIRAMNEVGESDPLDSDPFIITSAICNYTFHLFQLKQIDELLELVKLLGSS